MYLVLNRESTKENISVTVVIIIITGGGGGRKKKERERSVPKLTIRT